MSQTVYVLMSMEGSGKVKEWHPVAVVTDLSVAEQWQKYGATDWIPLELDDTKYLSQGEKPDFRPAKITPIEQRAIETARKLEETNQRLMKIIRRLQHQLGVKPEPETPESGSGIVNTPGKEKV